MAAWAVAAWARRASGRAGSVPVADGVLPRAAPSADWPAKTATANRRPPCWAPSVSARRDRAAGAGATGAVDGVRRARRGGRVVAGGAPLAIRAATLVARAAMRRSRDQSRNSSGAVSRPPTPRAAMAAHSASMMPTSCSAGEADTDRVGGEGGVNTNKLRTQSSPAGQVRFAVVAEWRRFRDRPKATREPVKFFRIAISLRGWQHAQSVSSIQEECDIDRIDAKLVAEVLATIDEAVGVYDSDDHLVVFNAR